MPKDDLAGKNLDDIGLAGSNLEQSDLSKSSLRRSNLRQANLRGANLAGSDLRDAHLQDADVTGADLSDADFTGANLEGVDLTQAATTEGAIGLPGDGAGAAPSGRDHLTSVGDVKIEVLDRVDTEWAAWESLIEAIPVAWIDLPDACGGWSVKDVIAHLNAWRQPFLNDLQATVQGTEAQPLDWPCAYEETDGESAGAQRKIEMVNAWIHERNAGRTHDQVLAESAVQWIVLRALVERMPGRLLTDAAAFPPMGGQSLAVRIMDGAFFSHFHDEHEPGIRAWLTRMHGRPAAG